MKVSLDNNRLYLVCLYFSMSFFYLSYVLGEDDPIPLLGYILALIVFIVVSHDALLRFISTAREKAGHKETAIDVAFLLELNRSIHAAAPLDLQQVSSVFSEKFGTRQTLFLLPGDLHPDRHDEHDAVGLYWWPAGDAWNGDFEVLAADHAAAVFVGKAPSAVEEVFASTGTNMLLPVADAGTMMCVILVERSDAHRPPSPLQVQAFEFLASQLGILFGRVRERKLSARSAG